VSAEKRLTAEQMAALSAATSRPSSPVPSSAAAGTQREPLPVSPTGRRGPGCGGGYAELVDDLPRADDEAARRARQIDLPYRDWTRPPSDPGSLGLIGTSLRIITRARDGLQLR
jgi:hypothetical protein